MSIIHALGKPVNGTPESIISARNDALYAKYAGLAGFNHLKTVISASEGATARVGAHPDNGLAAITALGGVTDSGKTDKRHEDCPTGLSEKDGNQPESGQDVSGMASWSSLASCPCRPAGPSCTWLCMLLVHSLLKSNPVSHAFWP